MEGILRRLFRIIPGSIFKNFLKCFYYNTKKPGLNAFYKDGYFTAHFKDIIVKEYGSPCGDLTSPMIGYLKKYEIKKGDIVVDAGAYLGTFTILASKLVGDSGKVISFEPDPQNYSMLLKNIKLNDIKNVITINKGLWSRDTELNLNIQSDRSSFLPETSESKTIVSTTVVSLDNELKRLKINKIDFIKMDVEGAELEALKGSEKILRNNKVNLAVASYHIVNGQKTCFEIEKMLSDLGYSTETSFPEHLTTYAHK
jgi:FkbM family methyltransferase